MKRFSLLFSLLILIGSFISAFAVDFQVEVDPTKTFIHPEPPFGTYYMGNTPVYLDIKMGNNSGMDIDGFIQTLRFYSTNGDGIPIIWLDAGGAPEGSIERKNGWEDDTYWDVTNEINTFSWDGSLPDTMNHTASSVIGWPDGDPTQTRLRFHFSVPVAGIHPLTDIVEICVDQSDGSDPAYDWLFPDASLFGGPYCFEFLNHPVIPPYVDGGPVQLTTSHTVPFNANYTIDCGVIYVATGICALDENSNPIGTITFTPGTWSFSWFFDPPCAWINDGLYHTVTFHVEDAGHGLMCPLTPGYTVTLTVTEGGIPDILENFETDILVRILETKEVTVELDYPGNDDEIWTYKVCYNPWGQVSFDNGHLSFMPKENDDGMNYTFTVRATDCLDNYDECDVTFWARSEILCGDPNSDLEVNILDVVFLINAKYKDGPGPGPLEISDVNNDGTVNILDIVRMINFKYKDGPILNCPIWE